MTARGRHPEPWRGTSLLGVDDLITFEEIASPANSSYRDPVMVSDGQAGLDAMLAGVQAKFPGFVLRRISKVDSHNNAVRFAWSLGPVSGPSVVEGVDFATLSADGKLANIVGFIDEM